MKITNHSVQQTSAYQYESVSFVSQTVAAAQALPPREEPVDRLELKSLSKEEAKQLRHELLEAESRRLEERTAQKRAAAEGKPLDVAGAHRAPGTARPQDPEELKLHMLLRMIQALSGKRFSLRRRNIGQGDSRSQCLQNLQNLQIPNMPAANRGRALQFEQTTAFHEYEATSFQAQGMVQTADGQTIAFDVQLNMSREFMAYSKTSLSMNVQQGIDPLVINYGGTAASLTGTKFAFDLDVDGQMDQISFAGAGSGFLALDKNGDGEINDGSELFGTQSGDGFADLRAYDTDGNGWIDENDDVYSKLRVWVRDENGKDQLFSLKEVDVGAIWLGALETPFTIGNSQQADGFVRATSFFLKDSGGAGTVQHIDLTR